MSPLYVHIIIGLLIVDLAGLLAIGLKLGHEARETHRLDRRITVLEARVQSMPTHHDLLGLRTEMTSMAESVAELSGQAKTMAQMLRTIQDYLLEKKR